MPARHLLAFFVLVACCSVPKPASAQQGRAGDAAPAADYEATLTTILNTVVTADGLVRYDLLRGPLREDFRRVLKAVETFDAAALQTPAQQLAFWINAYNVQMLQHIIERPDARDIVADGLADALFKTPLRTARLDVSLDEIENVILRGQPGRPALKNVQLSRLDPRIHVALNCAAVSCPPLRQRAFTAATLDAELNAALRAFTASPASFRVADGRVVLSSLLDWYGADFDRPDRPAGDYLLAAMPPHRTGYATLKKVLAGRTAAQIKALPSVDFAYDWTINRAAP